MKKCKKATQYMNASFHCLQCKHILWKENAMFKKNNLFLDTKTVEMKELNPSSTL